MNVDKSHLMVMPDDMTEEEMRKLGYEPIPGELAEAVVLELAGRKEARVGRNASGSVSTYMRKKREAKAAKALLRKNRREAKCRS